MLPIALGVLGSVALIGVARRAQRIRGLNHHPYRNPQDDAPGARAQTRR
jgi:hypothetical protein